MSIEKAYNSWAEQYDQMANKTRDLDKKAMQESLRDLSFDIVLEMGCGTGKNTATLLAKAAKVFGFDFSEKMLEIARAKNKDPRVNYQRLNLLEEWPIANEFADLICFNLVLEHIEELKTMFAKSYARLQAGGLLFVCELHPFKQYLGGKARFEKNGKMNYLDTFIHHVSDYTNAALHSGFSIVTIKEWFDEEKSEDIPRLISFLFKKN